MNHQILINIFGWLLILTSILDGWKYLWNAEAILQVGTSKGHSRKFLNVAILNDLIKLIYSITILDIFIFLSSLFALGTMLYNFYIQYITYPYKYRNLKNFKKPNIFIYFINSLIPNIKREHL
jgi:hypothetical protein